MCLFKYLKLYDFTKTYVPFGWDLSFALFMSECDLFPRVTSTSINLAFGLSRCNMFSFENSVKYMLKAVNNTESARITTRLQKFQLRTRA